MSVLFEILLTAVFSFFMSSEPVDIENTSGKEIKQVQELLFEKKCPSPGKEGETKRAAKYLAALSS